MLIEISNVVNLQIGELMRQLKEGALVISLKEIGVSPRPGIASMRDKDALGHIIGVTSHQYEAGSVSWKSSGGWYYLHVMNGEGKRCM